MRIDWHDRHGVYGLLYDTRIRNGYEGTIKVLRSTFDDLQLIAVFWSSMRVYDLL